MAKRICVVFNSKAGSAANVRQLSQPFQAKYECDFRATPDRASMLAEAEAAIADGARRIVVAGGDGTVSGLVSELAVRRGLVELAILPLGTGNDLARSLGIPLDNLEAALKLAIEGPAVPIDLIRLLDRDVSLMTNAATAGFGGQVAADISKADKARWGAFAYWITAATELVNMPQFDVRLQADERSMHLRVYGLAIANGRFVGGGFPIARNAFLNDGLLDVTVIPVLPAMELAAAGLNHALGLSPSQSIKTFQARMISVTATPPMPFSIDGEPHRKLEANFEVLPRRLHVVAGPQAPALTTIPSGIGAKEPNHDPSAFQASG